jgi:Protein of unknown function (DUF1553)/Protein of unknown function (DUF1549)/Planctomycete cytochrome C
MLPVSLRLEVCCALFWLLGTVSVWSAERPISFTRDIQPILSNQCYACHGFDESHRKADLRLDVSEAARASGVLKLDAAGKSELIARVTSDDPETQMPPAASKKSLLSKAQVALLERWIKEGAKYDTHWAFKTPVKTTPPEIKNADWALQPLDRFIAADHAVQGIAPAPEADKRTLIRRLSFDLTGLPPTATDVEKFVADNSPHAYENLVDRLLASPHYGERMAQYWLDVVRYADSAGYHSDNPRNVSPYRDYVINAFNNNLPFDQFTREQLAGDLLPNATLAQKVGSAYNRLLQTTEEGGAQPKEYTAKYAADRVRNFGSAWLGLTLGCCECHNHKFDPLLTKEFYSLQAYFADIQEAAVGRREPGIPVPNAEQVRELADMQAKIAAAQAALQTAAEQAAEQPVSDDLLSPLLPQWKAPQGLSSQVKGESKLKTLDDGSLLSIYKVAAQETIELVCEPTTENSTGLRLEVLAHDDLPARGPGTAPNGNFVLTSVKLFSIDKNNKEKPIKITKAVADHSQNGHDIATAIDNNDQSGWAVLPEIGKNHEAIFQFAEKQVLKENSKLKIVLEFRSQYPQHNIGRFRITTTDHAQPAEHFFPEEFRAILAKQPAERKPEERQKVVAFFKDRSTQLQPLRDQVQTLNNQLAKIEEAIPKSIISNSGAPRMVRLLPRGNWLDDSGEIVLPATPAVLGNPQVSTAEKRFTRLDLANWLLADQHPLTARVFVNRIWKLYFGRGLVKTAEDLGLQGEYPSHPELLDTLAVEFREQGWNVKGLVKQIVMSRTFRQSSESNPALREKDPQNIFLARQGRFRFEAETIRDNALAVSGLLVSKIGGRSVFPYQPVGYWSYLNFPKREWANDQGEELYRRGLYTHWQRTFLHPSLAAFDAPSREECTVDRARSNTPLQALALLNDVTYVEAARALAAHAIEAKSVPEERLRWMTQQVLQRDATAAEMKTLQDLLNRQLLEYGGNPKAVDELLSVGAFENPPPLNRAEIAAYTSIARVLLNLHETVTRY